MENFRRKRRPKNEIINQRMKFNGIKENYLNDFNTNS